MALSSSARKVAVEALVAKLKEQIEKRVAESNSFGSAKASWGAQEEIYGSTDWKGRPFSTEDARRRDQVFASYRAKLERLKSEEEAIWQAITELLQT